MNYPPQPAATYNAGNQLTLWNGSNLGSDNANNLTNDPTLPTPGSATWNERNQLASVNAGGAQNFSYDAAGRRESESGSIPTATFVYDGFTPVRTMTGSSNADLLAMPGIGEVFSRTDSSGTVVHLHDLAGSTIGLVDSTGNIVTQYAYTPFGRPTVSGANNANPFEFAGMEYDSTGLFHTWARYYSPGLQRFLSEDPIGIGGGDTNIFAYVHNDPVSMIDPLGLNTGSAGGGDYGGCTTCYRPPDQPIGGPPERPKTPELRRLVVQVPQTGRITIGQFDASFAALSASSVFGLLAGGYIAIVFFAAPRGIAVGAFVGAVAVGSFGYRLFIESGQSSTDSNLTEHADWGRSDPEAQFNFENNQQAGPGYVP